MIIYGYSICGSYWYKIIGFYFLIRLFLIGQTPPPAHLESHELKYVGSTSSHEQPTKLIVSLPTFSGRAHFPTHALHCYVQKDWPITPKKIEGFVFIYIVPPLGPTYIGERRITFTKAHGLEVKCLYEEHVREHIVNLGNILRTH
jgi:hypothetical protein